MHTDRHTHTHNKNNTSTTYMGGKYDGYNGYKIVHCTKIC